MAWTAVTLCALYVGSYLVLTVQGRYEPAVIGIDHVKSYEWAPRGFVRDYRWNRKLQAAYLPLYFVDFPCWHSSEKAHSGKYPINEVAGEAAVWDVYRAWKR